MATLYIAEFSFLGSAGGGQPQIAQMPPLAEQTVAIGAETDSAPFSNQTRFVRLHGDAACSIKLGGNATTANLRLPADRVEYFGVRGGDTLSVIAN